MRRTEASMGTVHGACRTKTRAIGAFVRADAWHLLWLRMRSAR